MAVAAAEFILPDPPIIGQFDDSLAIFVAVTDKGEGEFAVRVVLAAQKPHLQDFGVELERPVQIAGSQHGVQDSHVNFP
jgi:hypothetical protein